jgi:hypothetical protein
LARLKRIFALNSSCMKQTSAIHKQNRHHDAERGNVLWFILIVVVLLGALTMALSRSATNVDQSGDVEQQRISSSQILRYAKSLENAIQQLILNGCSESDISFENSIATEYENTNNPDNESCFIFSPEGAGLNWQSFSEEDIFGGDDFVIVNNQKVLGVGSDDAGARGTDLVMFIKMDSDLCLSINKDLGISTVTNDIKIDEGTFTDLFTGTFSATPVEIGNATGPALLGQTAGCGIDPSKQHVAFYVLLAR